MVRLFFYIAAMPIGIVLDWAIYARVSLLVLSVRGMVPSGSYRDYVFPRVLATILGSLAICYDAFHQEGDRRYLWIGVTLFLLSLLYAITATYWSGRQNHQ